MYVNLVNTICLVTVHCVLHKYIYYIYYFLDFFFANRCTVETEGTYL